MPLEISSIIGTDVIQGLTGRGLPGALGTADPEPTGGHKGGANAQAINYGEARKKAGHNVLRASIGWEGMSEARMKGLPVF